MTSRAQIPASGGSRTRDVGVQVELPEFEESAERESAGCSSGKLWSASLASSHEAGSMPSASLLAADPGPGGHLEALPLTGPEDGENSDSSARDVRVQDLQLELEEAAEIERAGQSSGTLQVASLAPSDEADTVCSPSHLDADPGPAGHFEPLPASVLEDAESSDSSEAACPAEEADAASLPLSVCEGGEREESADMPESSGQGLGEARRLPDPSEINREPYGHSPMIPAMRRIRDKDRNDLMLSHWNISWPRNVRSPRQRRLQARGDTFNNVGTVPGMPGIWPKTSWASDWFLDSGDTRTRPVRLPVIPEESSNESDSDEDMQDARDIAVRDEGMHPSSCPCPSAPENVEEDWECDSEEDAEAEAVGITSSTSDESSGEVEATSSASSVAADPMTEEHASACEEAEDVGPQHEVSQLCVVSSRHELEAEAEAVPGVCAVGRFLVLSPFQPAPLGWTAPLSPLPCLQAKRP